VEDIEPEPSLTAFHFMFHFFHFVFYFDFLLSIPITSNLTSLFFSLAAFGLLLEQFIHLHLLLSDIFGGWISVPQ
jgi:hypothetical protein